MGQLTQQPKVFIRAGGDTDGDVGGLPFAPGHALRELVNLNAGFQHLVAGIGGTVRNRNTVAKESGGLLLASQHPVDVAICHVARTDQRGGNLTNSLFFITGLLTGLNILHR